MHRDVTETFLVAFEHQTPPRIQQGARIDATKRATRQFNQRQDGAKAAERAARVNEIMRKAGLIS
jgi:hypothetical protein